MRLAWFRAAPPAPADPGDDTAALIAALRPIHEIDVTGAPQAHEFVWRHARGDYDLCIYEIADDPSAQFMWPYLLHVPGVLVLRTATLHDSRAAVLAREARCDDYAAEMAFSGAARHITARWRIFHGSWPMLRVPLLASRLTVVCDPWLAAALERDYPGARIRSAPVGVNPPGPPEAEDPPGGEDRGAPRPVTFGVLDAAREGVIHRAVIRAQAAGIPAGILVDRDVPRVLREADVGVALRWPSGGEPLAAARAAMAAAKPVIVSETRTTAGWPAFDPQTWRPRGADAEPIVVSIDPRDEEHSLVLAMRRLTADATFRRTLGRNARDWWLRHATVAHAAAAWRGILEEAISLGPPPRPADWPPHLPVDGTERAREILAEFGASVDFLP